MFDDLLAANDPFAASFDGAGLPRDPARRLVVVTCMDARIDVHQILGLRLGDTHVLRNAGGRVSDDVIRSLVVSTRILGVDTVVVMHHTACGMATISNRDVPQILPDVDAEHLESFDLLAIDDQEQTLRADVRAVQDSPLLPPLDVAGFLYDVTSGSVQRVC